MAALLIYLRTDSDEGLKVKLKELLDKVESGEIDLEHDYESKEGYDVLEFWPYAEMYDSLKHLLRDY